MSLWTTQQHQWLQALGYPVLLLAGDPALAEGAPSVGPAVASDSAPLAPTGQPMPVAPRAVRAGHPSHQAPERQIVPARVALPSRPAPVANPVNAAPTAGAAGTPRPHTDAAAKKAALDAARRAGQRDRRAEPAPVADPLLDAIVRIAGAAEETLAGLDIDLPRLRTDPQAKRALWIRLRTLRRGRDT